MVSNKYWNVYGVRIILIIWNLIQLNPAISAIIFDKVASLESSQVSSPFHYITRRTQEMEGRTERRGGTDEFE